MNANPKLLFQLRLQNFLFILLLLIFIGLLAWLSSRYVYRADWTQNNSNSLHESSIILLKTLEHPIKITAFLSDNPEVRLAITKMIQRYQRHKDNIQLEFIDPLQHPQRAREEGISMDGELLVQYQGRSEHLRSLSEQELSNTLQGLARSKTQQLVFIQGHGERQIEQDNNFSLSLFAGKLQEKGFSLQSLNLVQKNIPDNTSVLIIASPQINYLSMEVQKITRFIEQGGNLLWLNEPEASQQDNFGLTALSEKLSIEFLPGTIVDPTTQAVGIDNPAIAIIAEYPPNHAITAGFNKISLFPLATAINELPDFASHAWQSQVLFSTMPQSWLESGSLQGAVSLDDNDQPGPLKLALALWRNKNNTQNKQGQADAEQQRIVVIGDGDFLANSYLGNVGNLDLGMNIINWLSHDDGFINIPVEKASDAQLDLSESTLLLMAFLFLIILPLFFFASGIVIWLWRRKK